MLLEGQGPPGGLFCLNPHCAAGLGVQVPKEDLCKLLVHGIPRDMTEADLRALFGGVAAAAEGKAAEKEVKKAGKKGKEVSEGKEAEEEGAKKGSEGKKTKVAAKGAATTGIPAFESIEGQLSDKKVLLLFK